MHTGNDNSNSPRLKKKDIHKDNPNKYIKEDFFHRPIYYVCFGGYKNSDFDEAFHRFYSTPLPTIPTRPTTALLPTIPTRPTTALLPTSPRPHLDHELGSEMTFPKPQMTSHGLQPHSPKHKRSIYKNKFPFLKTKLNLEKHLIQPPKKTPSHTSASRRLSPRRFYSHSADNLSRKYRKRHLYPKLPHTISLTYTTPSPTPTLSATSPPTKPSDKPLQKYRAKRSNDFIVRSCIDFEAIKRKMHSPPRLPPTIPTTTPPLERSPSQLANDVKLSGVFTDFKFPDFKLPDFSDFKFPDFKLPDINFPDFKIPDIDFSNFKLPDINFPDKSKSS